MYVKKLETRSNGRKRNEVVALQMNVMIWQMPLFWSVWTYQDSCTVARSFAGITNDVSETLLQSPLFLSYFKTNLAHHLRKYYLDDSMLSLKGVPEEMLLVGFPDSFDL